MNIFIPGIKSDRFIELTDDYRIQEDDILICDPIVNIQSYAESIISEIQYDSDNLIIEASLLLSEQDKPSNYRGIELLKWLRIKNKIVNPIFVVGSLSLDLLLTKYPNQIIATAPGTKYLTFDGFEKDFVDYSTAIYPIENINDLYKPYVLADFSVLDKSHELANDYGFKKLNNFLASIDNSNKKIPLSIAGHKAEFLYPKNESCDVNYCKKIIEKLQKLFAQGLVNKDAVNKDGQLNDKLKKLKVAYIDDQGKNKWFKILRMLLGAQADITFIEPRGHYFNLIKTAQPDLIFLDLRLEGDSDKGKELDKISGAKLLKGIKRWNSKIPVVMLSATDKMKNMKALMKHPYNAFDLWTKPRVESTTTIYKSFKSFIEIATQAYHHSINDGELTVSAIKYSLKADSDRSNKKCEVSLNQIANNPLIDVSNIKLLFDTNYFIGIDKRIIKRWRVFNFLVKSSDIKPIVITEVLSELYNLTVKKEISYKIDWNRIFDGNIKELKLYLEKKDAIATAEVAKFAIEYIRENILKEKIEVNFGDYEKAMHNDIDFKSSKLDGRPEGAEYCVGAHRRILTGNFLNKENADELVRKNKAHGSKTLLHADPALSAMINYYALDNENTIFISADLDCKRQIALNFPSIENNIDDVYLKRPAEEGYPIHSEMYKLNFNETEHILFKNIGFLKLFNF